MANSEPQTFSLLGQLPLELADMIWDRAVQSKPGVQYFSLDTQDETPRHPKKFRLTSLGETTSILGPPHSLLSNENEPSWEKDNPSAYTTDGGLLSACKSSQAALQRHHRKNRRGQNGGEILADGRYVTDDGKVHHFRIYPDRDLVCITLPALESITDWDFARNTGIKNLAFEYNPIWATAEYRERIGNAEINSILDAMDMVDQVWLINYQVRPTARQIEAPKVKTFYGDGFRLVEVDDLLLAEEDKTLYIELIGECVFKHLLKIPGLLLNVADEIMNPTGRSFWIDPNVVKILAWVPNGGYPSKKEDRELRRP
ncbi:hypothetical protein G7046_g662 [Stylonectria norvegica]|nr:hypothetical protein G7046_g662 [Stylonectria norvegica]